MRAEPRKRLDPRHLPDITRKGLIVIMHDAHPSATPLADFSPERRATALSWIRGEGLLTSPVSDGAKVMAAVGLLICDDNGHLAEADLKRAMRDPSILQAACALLEEAMD